VAGGLPTLPVAVAVTVKGRLPSGSSVSMIVAAERHRHVAPVAYVA
jgi:hypothetical protein